MKSCRERCEGNGLLLFVPVIALSGAIPKSGGVGLVKYLLGGVKDSFQISVTLVNVSKIGQRSHVQEMAPQHQTCRMRRSWTLGSSFSKMCSKWKQHV